MVFSCITVLVEQPVISALLMLAADPAVGAKPRF